MTEKESKLKDAGQTLASIMRGVPEDYEFQSLDTNEAYLIANIHYALYGRFPRGYEYVIKERLAEFKLNQIKNAINDRKTKGMGFNHLGKEILEIIDGCVTTTFNPEYDALINDIKHECNLALQDNYNCAQQVLSIIENGPMTPEQHEQMAKGYELQNDPQEIPGERDRW